MPARTQLHLLWMGLGWQWDGCPGDENSRRRRGAAEMLAAYVDSRAVEPLIAGLRDGRDSVAVGRVKSKGRHRPLGKAGR